MNCEFSISNIRTMISAQTILNELQNAASFSELCRLCGKIKSPAIPIFDESHCIIYHELINFHFKNIQVSKTDVLPLKLCVDCAQFIVSWHRFHNTCLQVNDALLSAFDKLQNKFIGLESNSFFSKNDVEVIEVDVESVGSISPLKLPETNVEKLTVDENYPAEDVAEFSFKYVNDIVSNTLTTKTTTYVVDSATFSNSQNLSQQYTMEADEFLVDVAELSDSSKSRPQAVTKAQDEVVLLFPEIQDFSLLKDFILNDTTSKHHCSTCFKAHVTKEDLVDHICTKHESNISQNGMYECDMCTELFIQNSHRNSHRLIAHNMSTPLSTDFKVVRTNNQTTPSTIELEDENTFNCEYCDLNFNRQGNLKLHKMRKHGVIYQNIRRCNICSMIFLNKRALRLHVKTVHNKLLDESANTKITISEDYLQFLSKRIIYEGHIRYFQCDECQYKCRGLHRFMRHGSRHQNISFICAYCDKSFSHKGLLKRHICTVHLCIKKFDCSVCGKLFGERKHMQEHVSLHRDVCSYICEVCGKQFKQRQSLDVHKQAHRGKNSFSCQHCDKKFNFQNRLNNHMRKHTGENLSVCQLCGKKFTSSTNLKVHMLSHSDVKAFQCSVCSKRLKTNRSLKQHMKLCHGNIKHEPNA